MTQFDHLMTHPQSTTFNRSEHVIGQRNADFLAHQNWGFKF